MKAARCGQWLQCHMACMLLVLRHLDDSAVQFDMKVSLLCFVLFFCFFQKQKLTCLMFNGHFG